MTTLIGRAAELAAVAKLLELARTGCAGLSVIAAAGMGKSALVDAAAELAADTGWRVLRCRGVEAEAALAYSALTDLLSPVTAELDGWLPSPQRRALDVVMLRADPDGEVVEPHAVARAVTESLRILSRDRPVLLLLDDTHWLDPESARAIAFAVRRLDGSPLALLSACRTEMEIGAGASGIDALAPADQHRQQTVSLAPLTADEVEQLLAERGTALPRAALRRVQRIAAGHPLYALELARSARSAPDRAPAVPATLTDLLRQRLATLPEHGLLAVAAAAQLGTPTPLLVAAALDAEQSVVDSAIDAALDAGVLSERDDVLSFAHPLLAEAASTAVAPSVRRRMHRRLADAVGDAESRAVHLSAAHTEPDEAVALAIEAGATRARARAAPEVAAELIAAALRLTPADAVAARRRRRVDGAYHHVAAGQPEAGIDLMLAALEDESDGAGRAELEWRAGMMHFLAGDLRSCIELLAAAREHATDRAARNQISARLASMCCWANDFAHAADVAASVELDELTGIERINAMGTACVSNFATGRPVPIDPWQVVVDFEALRSPAPPHEHPIPKIAPMLLATGVTQPVADAAERALHRAADEADDIGIAWHGATLARAELHLGRWDAAARSAANALRAARRANSTPALVFGLAAVATVAAYRGQVDVATEHATELRALGEQQPLLYSDGHAHAVLGFLAQSRGDADTARDEYVIATRTLGWQVRDQPVVPPLRWYLVDALIDIGEVAEARQRADQLAAVDHPLAAAIAATGRGRLAALSGDPEAADAAFGEALTAHDRLGWPFERAITLYWKGCSLRDQRRRRLARESLDTAAGVFVALGAAMWASRARDALAAISGRAPSAPDQLTRTEDEVATLAATGLTNQQIAERLFISPKTVATHLSHAYTKLQVRSRTELAARLHRGS